MKAKRAITIRDLLTHTAGIGYGQGVAGDRWKAAGVTGWYFADRDEPVGATIKRMASLPFDAHPGERWVYGYATDILGALIERVSGETLDEFIRSRILAPLGIGLAGRLSLAQHRFREGVWDAVSVDSDQARGALVLRVAEPVGDPGRRAEAGPAKLEANELAALGVERRPACHPPFLQLLAIDRIDDAVAAGKSAKDAELAARRSRQTLDGPRLVGIVGIGAKRGCRCRPKH